MVNPVLIFVIGATNSGKGTFLAQTKAIFGDKVGLVEVGKMMRAKYPPEHFQGQAAPSHTQDEAWAMMQSRISELVDQKVPIIVVDGQPRDHKQLHGILNEYGEHNKVFVHLFASKQCRLARALQRDAPDVSKIMLSLDRLTGDIPVLYEILSTLMAENQIITTINTEQTDVTTATLSDFLDWLHTNVIILDL
jgi:adenylate kinase family enzyme